jgi:hypothetical protein
MDESSKLLPSSVYGETEAFEQTGEGSPSIRQKAKRFAGISERDIFSSLLRLCRLALPVLAQDKWLVRKCLLRRKGERLMPVL